MLDFFDVSNPGSVAGYTRFTLKDYTNGYIVKEITGLDPVKASLVSSTFANLDGAQYHTSRRDPRNIMITLGLKHKTKTVKELREDLYLILMPQTEILMSFYDTDGTFRSIRGVVESVEAPLFSQDPAAIISIMCYDPDFYKFTADTFPGSTVSVTGNGTINYAGTLPTGFDVQVNITANTSYLAVWHNDKTLTTGWRILRINTPFYAGDIVYISTKRGARSVRVTRAATGLTSSIVSKVDFAAVWHVLLPGGNGFTIFADVDGMPYTVSWYNKYGGL